MLTGALHRGRGQLTTRHFHSCSSPLLWGGSAVFPRSLVLRQAHVKKRRKKEKKPVARGAGEKWRCWWYRAGGHARDRMPLSQQAARSSSDGGSGLLGENPPRWRGKSPGRVSRRWPAWEKPTTWWGKAQAGCAACPRSSARRLVLSLCHGRMLRSQASRTSSYGCSLWPTRGKTHRSGGEKALAG